MSPRVARVLAFALLGLALGLMVAGYAVAALSGVLELSRVAVFAPLSCVSFATVGALVAAGAPRNAVGWLLLAGGLMMGAGIVTGAMVAWDGAERGSVPGASVAALLDGSLWLVFLVFLVPRLLLVFPDGRPPGRRWRFVGWGQWLGLAGLVVALLQPGPIHDYEEYDNPVGLRPAGWLVDHAPKLLGTLAMALYLAVMLASVASVLVRFRRSRGVERLQLKWVAWAIGVTAAIWFSGPVIVAVTGHDELGTPLSLAGLVGLVLCPVAIGIAVLRYRLYEIDRVVSRTLVYGSLTVVLALVYGGLVLIGQEVFSSFAGGSNLAIAVSTLVVAALFLPVRARLQGIVDRRFYRRRYDARRTVESFGSHLREQIDLDALAATLVDVATETMQPSHGSLWLRTESRS